MEDSIRRACALGQPVEENDPSPPASPYPFAELRAGSLPLERVVINCGWLGLR